MPHCLPPFDITWAKVKSLPHLALHTHSHTHTACYAYLNKYVQQVSLLHFKQMSQVLCPPGAWQKWRVLPIWEYLAFFLVLHLHKTLHMPHMEHIILAVKHLWQLPALWGHLLEACSSSSNMKLTLWLPTLYAANDCHYYARPTWNQCLMRIYVTATPPPTPLLIDNCLSTLIRSNSH